jgi:hypothetical protein
METWEGKDGKVGKELMGNMEGMIVKRKGKDGNIGEGRIGRHEREGWKCRRGTNRQVEEVRMGM